MAKKVVALMKQQGAVKVAPQVEHGKKHVMTSVRLRPDQIAALRRAALALAEERGHGGADHSEIIREAFDEWMSRHRDIQTSG